MILPNRNMTKEEKIRALKLRKLEELLKQYGVDLAYFKGEAGENGESIEGEQGEIGPQGERGETGQQGEIGPVGPHGDKGEKGDTGPRGPAGIDGKDGKTPVKGKDYFTQEDIRLILAQIKVPPVDEQAIIDKLSTSIDSRTGENQIVTVKSLIDFLKRGGFRGGAGTPSSNSGGVGNSFEVVSKNLSAYNSTLNYSGSTLTSIVYSNGVTKTLNYTTGTLTSIVLSGATPSGISLTKTLNYTTGSLTSITYS